MAPHHNPTTTTPPSLPAITSLPTLPDETLTSTLDLLFEPSPALHVLALPTLRRPFPSYDALIAAIRAQLLDLALSSSSTTTTTDTTTNPTTQLHNILASHPRLGEPKKETLSAQSAAEQAKLQSGGEEEAEMLARLNRVYEETFPGLRYVVFVNGRGRAEIMGDMLGRIKRGDIRGEEREGVEVSFFSFFFFCASIPVWCLDLMVGLG